MRTILPILALGLVACGKDTDSTEDSGDLGCEVEVRATFPAIDATDFYYKGTIEFQLNKADDTAELSIEGVEGTSWRNERNDIVFFKSTDDLSPSTAYTAAISYCTGDAAVNFTTSALGETLEASVDLTATTYSLDLQSGRVVIPEGVGAVLQEYLDFQILVQPTSVEGGEITLMGAVPAEESSPVSQDYCSPSIPFPAADFSNAPSFVFGPQSTTIEAAGYSITIDDLMISGTFSGDGEWFGGATLAGEIDTRPLVPILFEGEDDPNAICEFIEGFSVFCVPCEGDEAVPFCLEIEAQDLIAEATGGPVVEYIELEDCHTECADTWDENGDYTNPECTIAE
jgi:hypothetical protein